MKKIIIDPIRILSKDGRIVGEYLPDGSVKILKGSFFRNREVNSLRPGPKNQRLYLLNNGYIKNNQLVKDYIFANPSLAIASLMGHNASGQQNFVTIDNIELGAYLVTDPIKHYEDQKLINVIDEITEEDNDKNTRRFLDLDDNEKVITTDDVDIRLETKVVYVPEEKPEKVYGEKIVYPRNHDKAKRAIALANFKCDLDANHVTFINKKGVPYMEAHHLIPLSFQDYFEYSLDVEANIICLCPNCHRNVHYGKNIKREIEKLFVDRAEKLKQSGIVITLLELFKLYEMDEHSGQNE